MTRPEPVPIELELGLRRLNRERAATESPVTQRGSKSARKREFLDDWLRLGGTHHFVVNLGDQVERWRLLAEQLDLDYEEI